MNLHPPTLSFSTPCGLGGSWDSISHISRSGTVERLREGDGEMEMERWREREIERDREREIERERVQRDNSWEQGRAARHSGIERGVRILVSSRRTVS
jgi:hypothetical protein